MRPPPTGTVTFLFTDIEGSTRLWEHSPEAMRPALARHDRLLRAAIEDQDGHVFKTGGDAFCAAFAEAADALLATLAAQTALMTEPWETDMPLRVRMALHTGEAEERDGDYFGPPLNRVARLMAAGHGGQVLLSGAVQERVCDGLPPDTGLRDLGERRLKDLGRPERIFQLLHPGLPADFASLRSLDNPDLPNNLPRQVTRFIGRETEVAKVKALLEQSRLLTLTGVGGSGKSRLSLQVAADLLDRYFDGVTLVELAALSDPALVPQAVADALGLREEAGQTIRQTLTNALKSKRLLLVLDNCEHLVAESASLCADLLRLCPVVHILASSREPLGVAGEQTYRVPPLSLPDVTKRQTAESVSHFESVQLFVERAQAVQPSFAVTEANAAAVASVCVRLDGIPLALELAAARVRALPVEEVDARLDNRFRLLTGGSRTALPRQQTLRALIDWSYDLLTEPERTLLCRLSVFAGGWTLAAAEAVCSDRTDADFDPVDLLTSLVDKSLVVYEQEADGQGRFRLLETVREYALDRLRERREAEEVQEQAASWFLRLAEEAEGKLRGPEQAAWLGRLETEHDNLRASLSWYGRSAEDAEAGLRLTGALWRFWFVRGHYSEGRQWSARALEGAGAPEASAARAKAFHGAGNLAYGQGDFVAARTAYQESLTLRRHLGDQQGIAHTLGNLGAVAAEQGDYAEAQTLHEESLSLQRRLEDRQGIANSLGNLGIVASERGDSSLARVYYEEALTLLRRQGDQRGIANTLMNLGDVAYAQAEYALARDFHEESLSLQRRLEDQKGIASCLGNLGDVAFVQGDYSGARTQWKESLSLQRRLGEQQGIAKSLESLAGGACGQAQLSRAVRLLGASRSLRERIDSPLAAADQEKNVRRLTSIREAFGDEAFAAAWDAGRAMTLDEAVDYALSDGE